VCVHYALFVCRAAAYGRMSKAATAYNSVARGAVTTAGIWGSNSARFNDDIFGNGTVFVPPSKSLFVSRQAAVRVLGWQAGRQTDAWQFRFGALCVCV
jgi:hypothetical protein